MTAASKLTGLTLANGWKVVRRLDRPDGASGGMFSESYEVEKDGRRGFLKAFDFSVAFEPGQDTVAALQKLTASFENERTILQHCADRRLSNVVLAVDHGQVQIPGMGAMEGRVHYLIFEMADGDVRCQVDVTKRFDVRWSMRALREISLGLWQVHKEMIAHQDPKPSNVLIYSDKAFKIADFGRASRRGSTAPHDDYTIAGDRSYAPPELLYGFTHPEFAPRRIGCDLYLLGNLAAFLFSGRNVTAHLLSYVDPEHHPRVWPGTYAEVLPYLRSAFTKVLADLRNEIDPLVRDEVIGIITELCSPDIEQRGHPKGRGTRQQYSLERYVSRFTRACHLVDVAARRSSAA